MRTRPPAPTPVLLVLTISHAVCAKRNSGWLEPWPRKIVQQDCRGYFPKTTDLVLPASVATSHYSSLWTATALPSLSMVINSISAARPPLLDRGNVPPIPPARDVGWGGDGRPERNDAYHDKIYGQHTPTSLAGSATPSLAPRVYLFTKYPVPGQVKTRMIPALGREGAMRLHRRLVHRTLASLDAFRRQGCPSRRKKGQDTRGEGAVVDCRVRYDDGLTGQGGMALMQAWLGMDWIYEAQGPGDLGARLAAATAMADGGEEGVGSVVVVGSDCPFLRPRHLRAAIRALSDPQEGGGEEEEEEGGHDLVLGPATDGGYWLIGLRRPCPALFRDVDWGTSRVLNQTLARAESLGLKVKLLEALSDMDRPQDLALWRPPPLTSVVIPVVNEAECLTATLAAVFNGTSTHRAAATAGADRTGDNTGGGRGWKGGRKESTPTPSTTPSSSNREEPSARTSPGRKLKIHDPHVEVIVVDGGSTDGSERVARALGARVIRAPTAGRARQMNLGAAAANGDILLFLHADTLLPPTWEDEVKGAFAHHPSLLATAFRLRIMAPSSLFRVIEAGVSARSRWPWSMPYGDQALAVRRSVFEAVGGYPDVPVMEDFSFIQALHKMARTPPTSRPGGRDRQERKGGRVARQGGGRREETTEAGGLYGGKIRLLPSAVRTSARRWERLGVVRTTLVNQCMVLGWYAKVDPNKLAVFYRQARAGGTGGGRERGVEKRLVSLRGLWRRGGEEGAGRERGSEGREGGQAEGPGPAPAPPVSIRMGV